MKTNETNETQKLNKVQISTSCNYPNGWIVQVTLPDSPPFSKESHFVMKHVFKTALEAGKAIPDLKEFYKYFDITSM